MTDLEYLQLLEDNLRETQQRCNELLADNRRLRGEAQRWQGEAARIWEWLASTVAK